MSSSTQELYKGGGPSEHTQKVLTGERAPSNEYELQERLKWQYYQEQNPNNEDLTVEVYLHDADHQQQAHEIWVEHGMENAFRSLLDERRKETSDAEAGEEKTAPTDEPSGDDLSADQYVPGISLDDVMRRRAERQVG